MKKKFMPLIMAILVVTLINSGMLSFLVYDKIDTYIKERPIIISKDYDKGQTIEKALKTNKPVIIWFYTDWCRYCQTFAPTFKKIANDKKIKKHFAIAYVNAEDSNNKIYTELYDVKGYPTLYLVKENKKEFIPPVELFVPDAKNVLVEKFLDFLKND